MGDQVQSLKPRSFSILRYIGLRNSLIIYNKSSFRARIILASVPVGRIIKIGTNQGVNGEIEWDGNNRESDEVIAPKKSRKIYSHTSQSYLTILLEIDGRWKQLRKDKLINIWKHCYTIYDHHKTECIELNSKK